jgi:autotransporter strand-loop-strand O-heptosyltransferase
LPTQQGPAGIRFDFNQDARITLPKRAQVQWRVRLSDRDTGNILFETKNQGAFVTSTKRYFVRVRIDVWDIDDAGHATLLMSHACDARDRSVAVPSISVKILLQGIDAVALQQAEHEQDA